MDFVGIDKLSLLDYEDKVSVVLFSKTCNFLCPFCHNGDLVLKSETYIPFNEILDYLKSRKRLIDAVVISGGEPTLLNDLKEKIIAIKSLGFLIKLDTNGTNPNVLKDLFKDKLIDYVAMDIKNSMTNYPMTCGVNNVNLNNIKESIELIKNSGVDYEFRTTLVKEFHNSKSIKEMGELIQGSKVIYLQQFVERDGCIKKGLHPVSEDEANSFKEILSLFVKEVNLRGY